MTDRELGDEREHLLEPVDRISEVLFGLIMAATIDGSLSAATAGPDEMRAVSSAALIASCLRSPLRPRPPNPASNRRATGIGREASIRMAFSARWRLVRCPETGDIEIPFAGIVPWRP
jgi:hypothetical protein